MPHEWIIDAYNVLHHINDRKKRELQMTREDFFSALSNFAGRQMCPVTAVLDGVGEDKELSSFNTQFLRICYSQKVSADTCIEKMIYLGKDRCQWRVVTQDRAIANLARGMGALVITPREFMESLKGIFRDTEDTIRERKMDSHGFNRPFDKLLGP